jgi:hypothetical protein
MTPNLDPTLQLLTRRLGRALQAGFDAPFDPVPPLRQPAAALPGAPALLARAQPSPKARQEAQALYQRCLKQFRQRVQHNAGEDDAGLAAAYFVLANLAALQGLRPDEDDLLRVERQLRPRLALASGWMQAPLRTRQSTFEQFALLGVLVAESAFEARSQGAAAQANVQRAARGYLLQLLGIDPDRLRLGEHGLVLELAVA